jgi:sec-independent protein translocase protein TatA
MHMPFGTHWFELVPLVILALLFFGPKRLPEMGSAIGKTIKEFQKSMREVREPEPATTTAELPPVATPATLATTDAPFAQLPQASAAPAASVTAASPSAPSAASTPAATEPKASETSVS